MKLWGALSIVASLLVVPARAESAGPIVVCQHASITGSAPIDRDPARFGKFYFDYVNAELGGVDGRPVEFLTFDDRSAVPSAVQAFERCASLGADVVLGSTAVRDNVVAVAKAAENRQIPYFHSSAGAGDLPSGPMTAAVSPTDELQGRALARMAVANGPPVPVDPVIGSVRADSPWWNAGADAFADELRAAGSNVAIALFLPRDENDFSHMWDRLRLRGANIVHFHVTPRMWMWILAQKPAGYQPLIVAASPDAGLNVFAEFSSADHMAVLNDLSPAYPPTGTDQNDAVVDRYPYAAEIRAFKDVFDRYSSIEPRTPRDDVDWRSYLRAKQVHRLIDSLDGDMSPAAFTALAQTYAEAPQDVGPSCALDFASEPRRGARSWHVFVKHRTEWKQTGLCTGTVTAEPDVLAPAVSCAPQVVAAFEPLRCSAQDRLSGVSQLTVTARPPGRPASTWSQTGDCSPMTELEMQLPTGLYEIEVEASDCSGLISGLTTAVVAVSAS